MGQNRAHKIQKIPFSIVIESKFKNLPVLIFHVGSPHLLKDTLLNVRSDLVDIDFDFSLFYTSLFHSIVQEIPAFVPAVNYRLANYLMS